MVAAAGISQFVLHSLCLMCGWAQDWLDMVQGVYEFGKAPYKPLSSAKQVVWFWNEVGELVFKDLPKCRSLGQAWQSVRDRVQLLLSSVDAVLDPADPLPFLALHYQQVMPLGTACIIHYQAPFLCPSCIKCGGPKRKRTSFTPLSYSVPACMAFPSFMVPDVTVPDFQQESYTSSLSARQSQHTLPIAMFSAPCAVHRHTPLLLLLNTGGGTSAAEHAAGQSLGEGGPLHREAGGDWWRLAEVICCKEMSESGI